MPRLKDPQSVESYETGAASSDDVYVVGGIAWTVCPVLDANEVPPRFSMQRFTVTAPDGIRVAFAVPWPPNPRYSHDEPLRRAWLLHSSSGP